MKTMKSKNWCFFSTDDGELYSTVNITAEEVIEIWSMDFGFLDEIEDEKLKSITDEELLKAWEAYLFGDAPYEWYDRRDDYKIYLIQDEQLIETNPCDKDILDCVRKAIKFRLGE